MGEYSGFGNRQSKVSADELRKRLKSHLDVTHEKEGIPRDNCLACKSMKRAIKLAVKQRRK